MHSYIQIISVALSSSMAAFVQTTKCEGQIGTIALKMNTITVALVSETTPGMKIWPRPRIRRSRVLIYRIFLEDPHLLSFCEEHTCMVLISNLPKKSVSDTRRSKAVLNRSADVLTPKNQKPIFTT